MSKNRAAELLPLLCLSTLLPLGPVLAQETAPGPSPIVPDDMFRVERVGTPAASPDGRWLAYTVSKTSLEDERSTTRIWMVSVDGGDPISMTGEGQSASNPSWRPGADMLTFQGSRNGSKTQVWGLSLRGGEARQLSKSEEGISGYWWSPDGSRLLLSIRDPEEEGEEGGEEDDAPEPWVIDRLQFKRDNVGYLDRRRSHLYVQDMTSGGITQITSGDYDDSSPAWSPDGRRIAFVSNRTEEPDANANSDIWIVAADNSDLGASMIRVTTNPGSDGQPAWSPDGRTIAYTTVVEPDLIWYATRHLATVLSGGEGGTRTVLQPRSPFPFGSEGAGRGAFLADEAFELTERFAFAFATDSLQFDDDGGYRRVPVVVTRARASRWP